MILINSEAEKYALAAAFEPNGLPVFDLITDDLIASPPNQLILAAIRQLIARSIPVSIITVTQQLRATGGLDAVGGAVMISDFLGLTVPSVSRYQVDVLREMRATRQAHKTLTESLTRFETGDEPGEIVADARARLDEIQAADADRIEARALAELSETDPLDAELIRHRFLCRGGGALLVGPSGIGKSTLALQLSLGWAIDRPIFGMQPAQPLESLFIQAENDEADLREMRDGALAGLCLSGQHAAIAAQRVRVHTCDSQSGQEFLRGTLETLVRRHRPAIVWIDPAFAYLGGDASSQPDVSAFLRNGLNPILHRHNCAAIIVHHTNKPKVGTEKATWQAGDFAYLGSGSAEWTNWSRAVLSIQSLGSHSVFKLHAAKRGARLRWADDNGDSTRERHIAHAKEQGRQFWRDADPDEIPGEGEGGRPQVCDVSEVLQALNGKEQTFTEVCAAFEGQASSKTVQRRLGELARAGKAVKTTSGKWKASR